MYLTVASSFLKQGGQPTLAPADEPASRPVVGTAAIIEIGSGMALEHVLKLSAGGPPPHELACRGIWPSAKSAESAGTSMSNLVSMGRSLWDFAVSSTHS